MPSTDARYPAQPQPGRPSSRLAGLAEACFLGQGRSFVNALIPIALNSPWDGAFAEAGFLAAPGGLDALPDLRAAFDQSARRIDPPRDFYRLSVAERRVWLIREALTEHAPLEILPGDLLAGARCNLMLSRCLSKAETKSLSKLSGRRGGLLGALSAFQTDGRGRAGLTGGRLAPDYPHVLAVGFSGIQAELRVQYDLFPKKEREGGRGVLLRTMMDAARLPVLLAERYAALCGALAEEETDRVRKAELLRMAQNLAVVPAGPAQDFYQAVQSLWLAHMALIAEENGAGGNVSLGRVDQYLLPYWRKSIQKGMDPALGKEIVGCLLLHLGSVRDAMTGYEGPACAAGEGQTFLLSGLMRSPDGSAWVDETNELTHVFLEAYGELPGLSGAEPLVLLHRRSPDALIRRLGETLSRRPDAPLRVRFAAPSVQDASLAGEETAAAFPTPSGEVGEWCAAEGSVQLGKAVELALTGGRGLDALQDARRKRKRQDGQIDGPDTGDAASFDSFETLYEAFREQLSFLIEQAADLSGRAAAIRSMFAPAPFASCLIPGCGESVRDVTGGGAARSFVSIQAAGLATAVDSLLAVRYLLYERGVCGMEPLTAALSADWYGYELLQSAARYRAPRFGRDDPVADALAARVAADFAALVAKLPPTALGADFRPGFDQALTAMPLPFATPDGRNKGEPASAGYSPAAPEGPAPATALVNSLFAAITPAGGAAALSLPGWDLSHPEEAARLKAFLMGAAVRDGLELLLFTGPDALPTEGEPDYDCVPVREDETV